MEFTFNNQVDEVRRCFEKRHAPGKPGLVPLHRDYDRLNRGSK